MSALTEQFRLDPREAAFVVAFVKAGGRDIKAAMIEAGYSESYAQTEQNTVTRRPQIVAAIHIETARRLQRLAPGAIDTVEGVERGLIVENAKVRLDAAKTILDRAGHIAPRARAPGDGQERTLSEMSLDELKATQDRLQAEILNRAKPVSAHESAPIASQDADLLG